MPQSPLSLQSSKSILDVRYCIVPPGPIPSLALLHKHGTPLKSFTYNFLGFFWVQFAYAPRSLVDNLGVTWLAATHTTNLQGVAAIGESFKGIQVGSGATPPIPEDYMLQSLISHGAAANQLSYGASSFISPYIVSDITYAAIARTITALAGQSNYVNEIGLSLLGYSGGGRHFLVARDVLASTITFTPGISKQFIYTFATEV